MDELYTWIKNIVIYMILNTIIMNLLGNKSYKKYVSIISGMILMLIVISPLMNYMELEDKLEYFFQANDFAIEASDFKNDLYKMEEEQSRAIFDEYKSKIETQVESLLQKEGFSLEQLDTFIDSNTRSNTFGEIIRMEIIVKVIQIEDDNKNEEKESYKELFSVKEIVIPKITIGDQEDTPQNVPSPMEITIKNKIADFYNIKKDNINISIQGGNHG